MRERRHPIFFARGILGVVIAVWAVSPAAWGITIDWVSVGDAGNAPDVATGSLYGAVGYDYKIAKYDVTVGQYTAFLNAVAADDTYGLYNPSMATNLNVAGISQSGSPGNYSYSVIGSPNKPVTYVSWGDAARFANWIQNGQPTGGQDASTTERGAYQLDGATSEGDLAGVTRGSGAKVFLPSEAEWYKAAYYDAASDTYYPYAFSSNAPPVSQTPGNTPNTANFGDLTTGYAVTGSTVFDPAQNYLTDVGAYTDSASPYGAFDMGGNLSQWNETSLRGGSWSGNLTSTAAETRFTPIRSFELYQTGFRLATVPEPSTFVLAGLASLALCAAGKRVRRNGKQCRPMMAQ